MNQDIEDPDFSNSIADVSVVKLGIDESNSNLDGKVDLSETKYDNEAYVKDDSKLPQDSFSDQNKPQNGPEEKNTETQQKPNHRTNNKILYSIFIGITLVGIAVLAVVLYFEVFQETDEPKIAVQMNNV